MRQCTTRFDTPLKGYKFWSSCCADADVVGAMLGLLVGSMAAVKPAMRVQVVSAVDPCRGLRVQKGDTVHITHQARGQLPRSEALTLTLTLTTDPDPDPDPDPDL